MTPVTAEAAWAVCAMVRAEFEEMPTLRLTPLQVQRLFELSKDECREVLDELVAEGFLCRRENGQYSRCDRQTRS